MNRLSVGAGSEAFQKAPLIDAVRVIRRERELLLDRHRLRETEGAGNEQRKWES
jgi:hypothetical protein